MQVDVQSLSAEQKKVVDFAVVQLQGLEEGGCGKKLLRVENFSQQVVAGLRYKFDLVLTGGCHGGDQEQEQRCSMDVYSVPWQQQMSVLWEHVRCGDGDTAEATTKPSRIRLSVPLMKDLPAARVGIVDLSPEAEEAKPDTKPLLGGGDHDKIPHPHGLTGSDKVLHGPVFSDEYTAKELKSEKQSLKELKSLQSLSSFHDFMAAHGRNYSSRREYKHRYEVFRQNMKKVQFLRESEQGTAEYGHTIFADLTEMEFKQYLGTPVWKRKRMGLGDDPDVHWPAAEIPDVELPEGGFDWREHGAVTEVKNQGTCGSCWSFSTTGSMEGAHFISTGKLVSLSDQQLVSCSHNGNMGCMGGMMDRAFKWTESNPLETEADYPYKGWAGFLAGCKTDESLGQVSAKSYVDVTPNSSAALKAQIAKGPVSVAVQANQAVFQRYKGGIIRATDGCGTKLDHGVLAVGYGVENGVEYYKVKNSWGTTYGEDGYVRLEIADGAGVCGIQMQPSQPTTN